MDTAARTTNTLESLVRFNDRNVADLGISDLLDDAPLLRVMHAQVASQNTLHKYTKQTVASGVAFRAMNAGLDKVFSQDVGVSIVLQIMDGTYHADVAQAQAYRGGVDAFLQRELARTIRAKMFLAERSVIYGDGTTNNVIAGLIYASGTIRYLDDDMVVVPETAGSGDLRTSVYVIRHGESDVSFLLGNEGEFTVTEEPRIVPWQPAHDNTATYPAYYVPVTGWAGLQPGGAYSAARVANVLNSLTGDDLYAAIAKFPAGRQPNAIVMNRRAQELLRKSRTAVNQTGAEAPRPTEFEGIPIVVTDAIADNEAVVVNS
jgi:hypothetical protein